MNNCNEIIIYHCIAVSVHVCAEDTAIDTMFQPIGFGVFEWIRMTLG